MIRSKRLRELEELVGSEDFLTWHRRYLELRAAIDGARERREELLAERSMTSFSAELSHRAGDEVIYRAGEREDLAARAASELAAVENDSLEVLSAYELQRERAREVWDELARREGPLEDKQREAAELRVRLDDASRSGSSPPQTEAVAARLRHIEREIEASNAELAPLTARLAREDERKTKLWNDEEAAWLAAMRASLARSEYVYQARRLERQAEAWFARAAAERREVDELQQEADREGQRLASFEREFADFLEQASQRFECVLVEAFLYWPKPDDLSAAYCIPLIDEPHLFPFAVRSLHVYQVRLDGGLEGLEPVAGRGGDTSGRVGGGP